MGGRGKKEREGSKAPKGGEEGKEGILPPVSKS